MAGSLASVLLLPSLLVLSFLFSSFLFFFALSRWTGTLPEDRCARNRNDGQSSPANPMTRFGGIFLRKGRKIPPFPRLLFFRSMRSLFFPFVSRASLLALLLVQRARRKEKITGKSAKTLRVSLLASWNWSGNNIQGSQNRLYLYVAVFAVLQNKVLRLNLK